MARSRGPSHHEAVIEWAEQLYELRDRHGDRIGDVIEVNPEYLVVQRDDWLLGRGGHHRYYVPVAALRGEPEYQYRVSIDRDDLDAMGLGEPPTGSAWSGAAWRARIRRDFPAYIEGFHATRLVGPAEGIVPTTTERKMRLEVVPDEVVPDEVVREDPVERTEVTMGPVLATRRRAGHRARAESHVGAAPAKTSKTRPLQQMP